MQPILIEDEDYERSIPYLGDQVIMRDKMFYRDVQCAQNLVAKAAEILQINYIPINNLQSRSQSLLKLKCTTSVVDFKYINDVEKAVSLLKRLISDITSELFIDRIGCVSIDYLVGAKQYSVIMYVKAFERPLYLHGRHYVAVNDFGEITHRMPAFDIAEEETFERDWVGFNICREEIEEVLLKGIRLAPLLLHCSPYHAISKVMLRQDPIPKDHMFDKRTITPGCFPEVF